MRGSLRFAESIFYIVWRDAHTVRYLFVFWWRSRLNHPLDYIGSGRISIDPSSREDVTLVPVPRDCIGYVMGDKHDPQGRASKLSGTESGDVVVQRTNECVNTLVSLVGHLN